MSLLSCTLRLGKTKFWDQKIRLIFYVKISTSDRLEEMNLCVLCKCSTLSRKHSRLKKMTAKRYSWGISIRQPRHTITTWLPYLGRIVFYLSATKLFGNFKTTWPVIVEKLYDVYRICVFFWILFGLIWLGGVITIVW